MQGYGAKTNKIPSAESLTNLLIIFSPCLNFMFIYAEGFLFGTFWAKM